MTLNIPKLQRNLPIVRDVYASDEFHIWWQTVVNALIDTINQQQQQIDDIEAALTSATEAKRSTARINSYTTPTDVISASDAGSDATISIAAHTRIYPNDGTVAIAPVAIEAGSITSLLYSTKYYVYYDDPTLTDTTPLFLATTSASIAQVGAGPYRHFVGVVTTPSSGGGPSTGGGGTPPGGGGGPIP